MADPVAEFVMVTGATTEQAIQILETVNYNVEEAVNLFFASQDVRGGATTGQQSPAFPSFMDEDDVPPPKETTRHDQLLGAPGQPNWLPPDWQRSRQALRTPPEGDVFFGASSVFGRLFQPPDFCFIGTLDQAKNLAIKEGKWLLVNIVGANDFHSQRLNRDTWSNDTVTATVVAYFVFWQQESTSEGGALFTSLYHVGEAPTCVILDPRTGEAVASWVGFLDCEDMSDRLTGFLDRNLSLMEHDFIANPTPTKAGPLGNAEDDELQKALLASAEDDALMEENKELALAIAASMAPAAVSSAKPPAPAPAPPAEWKPSVDLTTCFSDAAAEGFGRIAIQLADSTNCRTNVKLAAPAKALLDFVKTKLPEAQTRPFKLLYGFPPKPVPDGPGETIESAKLQGERVIMAWE
eukprot:GGOE01049540.1.p1 GENE.GGOE01049540.1~~GGOE01049540.1.p1  ORF type:complete len:420 (-),score=138.49 GGOE01049540.1:202-1428(-)